MGKAEDLRGGAKIRIKSLGLQGWVIYVAIGVERGKDP